MSVACRRGKRNGWTANIIVAATPNTRASNAILAAQPNATTKDMSVI